MNWVVWRRRGAIGEHVADEEADEKRFHVPATSLEALSAIQRCCRDMEALCSDFHVGDVGVGVGVGGGCRGRRFGRRGSVVDVEGVGSVFGCQMHRDRKKTL